jgi:hypothetical protein
LKKIPLIVVAIAAALLATAAAAAARPPRDEADPDRHLARPDGSGADGPAQARRAVQQDASGNRRS